MPDIVKILANGTSADRMIAKQFELPSDTPRFLDMPVLKHPSVRHIFRIYGMYNVHPGSIFFMKEALKQPDPVGFLRGLELDERLKVPRYAKPFEPYSRRLEAEGRALRKPRAV